MVKVINDKFKSIPPQHVKTKINKMNKLVKKLKHANSNPQATLQILKFLNKDIKVYFHQKKIVRKGILPGSSVQFWMRSKWQKISIFPLNQMSFMLTIFKSLSTNIQMPLAHSIVKKLIILQDWGSA